MSFVWERLLEEMSAPVVDKNALIWMWLEGVEAGLSRETTKVQPVAERPIAQMIAAHEVRKHEDHSVRTAAFIPDAPALPLPEHVTNSDESEKVLFQSQAKLFRLFGHKNNPVIKPGEKETWKFLNAGKLKLIQNRANQPKIRIEMWNESEQQIICNHWISKDTELSFCPVYPKELKWNATDFVSKDEERRLELLRCEFEREDQVCFSGLICNNCKLG